MNVKELVVNAFFVIIFGALIFLGVASIITGISYIFIGESWGKIAIAIPCGVILTWSSISILKRVNK